MPKITHSISSELGTSFTPFHGWAKSRLSTEEFNSFTTIIDTDTTEFNFEYSELYNAWLVDQKIIHKIFHDGVEYKVNSYTDFA